MVILRGKRTKDMSAASLSMCASGTSNVMLPPPASLPDLLMGAVLSAMLPTISIFIFVIPSARDLALVLSKVLYLKDLPSISL